MENKTTIARKTKLENTAIKKHNKREEIRKTILSNFCTCPDDLKCEDGHYQNICLSKKSFASILETKNIISVYGKTTWTIDMVKKLFPEMKPNLDRKIEIIRFQFLEKLERHCTCMHEKCYEKSLSNLCITKDKAIQILNNAEIQRIHSTKIEWDYKELQRLIDFFSPFNSPQRLKHSLDSLI